MRLVSQHDTFQGQQASVALSEALSSLPAPQHLAPLTPVSFYRFLHLFRSTACSLLDSFIWWHLDRLSFLCPTNKCFLMFFVLDCFFCLFFPEALFGLLDRIPSSSGGVAFLLPDLTLPAIPAISRSPIVPSNSPCLKQNFFPHLCPHSSCQVDTSKRQNSKSERLPLQQPLKASL